MFVTSNFCNLELSNLEVVIIIFKIDPSSCIYTDIILQQSYEFD